MRIMTLNMHKGFGLFNRNFILPAMRKAIRSVSADIVLLQEVIGEHHEYATRYENWPLESQYEFLADSIWPDFAYGKNAVTDNSHHGNAMLSKFPINAWCNHDLPVSTGEARGVLHCDVQWPLIGERLHLCCVHLGLKESDRQQQLQMLCEVVEREIPPNSPLVVAGDFNDWRCRACGMLHVRLGLIEAFTDTVGKPPRTYPAKFPALRLDRVYSRNIKTGSPQVLTGQPWSRLSDHAALTVDLAP
ncbi:MAG TPA: endonuclease/exonuclease/phosphatase family protein [Halioglobus sp.]